MQNVVFLVSQYSWKDLKHFSSRATSASLVFILIVERTERRSRSVAYTLSYIVIRQSVNVGGCHHDDVGVTYPEANSTAKWEGSGELRVGFSWLSSCFLSAFNKDFEYNERQRLLHAHIQNRQEVELGEAITAPALIALMLPVNCSPTKFAHQLVTWLTNPPPLFPISATLPANLTYQILFSVMNLFHLCG